jgi:bacterioferritin-associated ferredoxin
MFVCNCNGVRSRDMAAAVDAALDEGSASVPAVYRACGVTPKCGRCAHDIKRMLDDRMGEAHRIAAQ